MKVIGIVGAIGAGKDTVADYVSSKYGFRIVSYRDIVKEITEKEGLEPNRENMQKTAKMYRDKHGPDIFANLVMEKARKINGNIILKEMRTVGDIKVPRKHFKDIKIICVESPPEMRYDRLKKRGRLGDPKDFEEFTKNEETEKKFGFYEGIKMADIRIDNTGTQEELHRKVDKMMNAIM